MRQPLAVSSAGRSPDKPFQRPCRAPLGAGARGEDPGVVEVEDLVLDQVRVTVGAVTAVPVATTTHL